MAFKLSVQPIMMVPVKGSISDAKGRVSFSFELLCKRLSREEYAAVFAPDSSGSVREFFRENVTGWQKQKLVLNEDGSPADFSIEALDFLLDVTGIESAALTAYIHAYDTAATREGRSGN
jgi:hypothetical protein